MLSSQRGQNAKTATTAVFAQTGTESLPSEGGEHMCWGVSNLHIHCLKR